MPPRSQRRDLAPDAAATPRSSPQADSDATLAALEDLVVAAEQVERVTTLIRERAREIAACRREGLRYREIVQTESRPLIAEAITGAIAGFEAAGTRFRQAQAAALREEGLTLEEIGGLFGLTRQRISGLLQEATGRSHP